MKALQLFGISIITLSSSLIYCENNPHRIYIGETIFYRDYHEKLPAPAKSDEYGIFNGLQFGYEYKKRSSIYAGADFYAAWGDVTYDGSLQNFLTDEITPHKGDAHSQIYNPEIRLGYNFSPISSLELIPYAGAGYFQWDRHGGTFERYSWEYGLVGFWTNYIATTFLEVGINLKLMHMINGKIYIDEHLLSLDHKTLHLGNKFQYGVELPLTFFLDRDHQYDFRIVPFFYKRDIGKSNSTPGTFEDEEMITHEGRIFEPASTSYQVGAVIELGYHF